MIFGLGSRAAPPQVIAVDFGVSSLKALQFAAGPGRALVAAASIPTPDEIINKSAERLAFQAQALPGLLKSGGFKGRRVAASIPSEHTQVRNVQPPKTESKGPASADAARILAGVDPTAIAKTIIVGEVNKGGARCHEVLVFATPREIVLAHVRALTNAKLEPVGMHSEHLAGLRAFTHGPVETSENSASLYIDIGYGTTKLTIAHGESAVLAKIVPIGGSEFDRAMAKSAGRRVQRRGPAAGGAPAARDSTATATALLEATAALDLAIIAPLLDTLTDEAQMALRYHRAIFPDRSIERLIVMGGESSDPALVHALGKALRLKAEVADPFAGCDRAGVSVPGTLSAWAVPVGLCFSPTDV